MAESTAKRGPYKQYLASSDSRIPRQTRYNWRKAAHSQQEDDSAQNFSQPTCQASNELDDSRTGELTTDDETSSDEDDWLNCESGDAEDMEVGGGSPAQRRNWHYAHSEFSCKT